MCLIPHDLLLNIGTKDMELRHFAGASFVIWNSSILLSETNKAIRYSFPVCSREISQKKKGGSARSVISRPLPRVLMNFKKAIFLMLIISCMFLPGCSRDTGDKTEKEPVLEAYDGGRDAAVDKDYKHLEKVSFEGEDYFLSTYIPSSDNLVKEETSASSSVSGISVTLSVFEEGDGSTPGKALEDEYLKMMETVKTSANIQNEKIYDVIEADGCWILQIDYNIIDGNNLYPCAVYIKVDDLGSGHFLKSVVSVNNQEADEAAADILPELLDAYGIQIQ